MKQRFAAKIPSEMQDLWPRLSTSEAEEIQLTLQLYTPLVNAEEEGSAADVDETIGPRVLEQLYTEWAKAITNAPLPDPSQTINVAKWRFILDITRPPIYSPNARLWEAYEARGLARITTVLRSIFRDRGTLEAIIVGAPCWCFLAESEKHVMLPKGISWPLQRSSHVQVGEPATNQARTCLKLSKEHWNDEHWGVA